MSKTGRRQFLPRALRAAGGAVTLSARIRLAFGQADAGRTGAVRRRTAGELRHRPDEAARFAI
jgi:hypothetical protein